MIEAIIGWTLFFLYVFVAGLVTRWLLENERRKCPQWPRTKAAREGKGPRPDYSWERCEADDHMWVFIIGPLWFFVWPALIGVAIAGWLAGADDRRAAKVEELEAEYAQARKIIEDAGLDWPEMPGDPT